jgi:5-methylcytosine-specific restriction endonuclease McrA
VKACTHCGGMKPLSEFYAVKATGKLHSWCKPCVVASTNTPESRRRNTERNRRFRLENPYTWRAGQLNRKAKRHGIPGAVTKGELEVKWHDLQGRCHLKGPECLGDATEWDHGVPVTRYGSSGEIWNLWPACRSCNARKNNLTLSEWWRERSWRLFDVAAGYVHPTALIGSPPEARNWRPGDPIFDPALGDGVRVSAFVTIDAGVERPTRVGARTFVMAKAHLGHDVIVGPDSEIAPGVVIGGYASLGQNVRVGMNATIRNRISIGDGARIGMGAVVVKDVPAGETWVGNPAKALR